MKRGLIFTLLVAFGLMLWGCSSQTQDPVSSVSYAGSTGPQILHKTIAAPTNIVAVVAGFTATITWDSVALADSYHVAITFNGNPYLDVKQVERQLAVPNLLFGSYSVTVAAIVGTLPEGTASTPVVFTLTLAPPTNLHAAVNGSTATITWDPVATADGYHVVITLNGNPYLDITQAARQLVVPNLLSGTYSVTVAAIVSNKREGTTSTPVVFMLSSVVAPTVTVTASPIPRCVRNGAWVTVTFSGVVTNSKGGASYKLKDEYKKIHYTGTVAAGSYSVKLNLKDRRLGFDKDGRQYTFTITATNSAGTATASVVVTVPQDKKFRGWNDDDDDDDNWGWRY